MEKADKQGVAVDYYNAPSSGVEISGINIYTSHFAKNKPRRIHGNLEIIGLDKGLDAISPKSYYRSQVDLDYFMGNVHIMHVVRHEFSRQNCRESLWARAVENLYRRINFLQLNIEFLQDDITDDEFEQTLIDHESDYVISIGSVKDSLEAEAIHDIVLALGRSFDVHEVAELFGVEPESLHDMQMRGEDNKGVEPNMLLNSGS